MKKVLTYLGIAVLVVAGIALAGGAAGYRMAENRCAESIRTDTVYVTDTITVTRTLYDSVTTTEYKPYPVVVSKTDTIVDTQYVLLPIEHRLAHYPDMADIWYSGYDAKVDSVSFYIKERVVTTTVTETERKMPRMTIDVGAGALYWQKDIFPHLAVEMRYNAPKTSFSAYGLADHNRNWVLGVGVSHRIVVVR